ncbi:hypothetical protein QN277_012943 [Acacia crassicarpa]|uniref:Uncharacterized protein n=1 Tax=Acacia crassicarpa TaxID=499986 RepID=A0AAE1TF34_9FABA|nr:hypothetical protein QN277_012943 [Acacia crassicarpa]
MAEKCLVVASLAALVFHPRSSIKCFKPKPNPNSTNSTTTPQKNHKPAKKKQGTPPKLPHEQPKHKAQSSSSSSIARNSSRSNQLTELLEGDWPIDIVAAMFRAGWPLEKTVVIEKILKVNHSLDHLTKFEEYREGVKSMSAKIREPERTQKLVVDGNELVRFHGALIKCSLGRGNLSLDICSNRWCAVCRMVSSTFPVKDVSVTLYENSWRAHAKIDGGSVGDRASARTASVLCRVIAGRIANFDKFGATNVKEGGFDSMVSPPECASEVSEGLVVLNQRAILPCFVVIYRAS